MRNLLIKMLSWFRLNIFKKWILLPKTIKCRIYWHCANLTIKLNKKFKK